MSIMKIDYLGRFTNNESMGFIWFHVILWKMVHTPNWQSRWQSDPDGVKDV
jgi:hypothetical protein